MSPLFKKKEKITIPVSYQEKHTLSTIPTLYTPESLEHRFALLLKSEKKVEERIARLQRGVLDLLQQSAERIKEITVEGGDIKKESTAYREQCNNIIKGVALTTKREDFEKVKRFIEQYDFAEMITRDEFEKL